MVQYGYMVQDMTSKWDKDESNFILKYSKCESLFM